MKPNKVKIKKITYKDSKEKNKEETTEHSNKS
jgi:hypothetical protein